MCLRMNFNIEQMWNEFISPFFFPRFIIDCVIGIKILYNHVLFEVFDQMFNPLFSRSIL